MAKAGRKRRSRWEILDEEANAFAAYLLMPSPLFEEAMAGVDLTDDEALERVARKFRVGIGAVCYRSTLP